MQPEYFEDIVFEAQLEKHRAAQRGRFEETKKKERIARVEEEACRAGLKKIGNDLFEMGKDVVVRFPPDFPRGSPLFTFRGSTWVIPGWSEESHIDRHRAFLSLFVGRSDGDEKCCKVLEEMNSTEAAYVHMLKSLTATVNGDLEENLETQPESFTRHAMEAAQCHLSLIDARDNASKELLDSIQSEIARVNDEAKMIQAQAVEPSRYVSDAVMVQPQAETPLVTVVFKKAKVLWEERWLGTASSKM